MEASESRSCDGRPAPDWLDRVPGTIWLDSGTGVTDRLTCARLRLFLQLYLHRQMCPRRGGGGGGGGRGGATAGARERWQTVTIQCNT